MKTRIAHALRRAAGAWFMVLEFAFAPITVFSFILIALIVLIAMSVVDWYRSGDQQCNDLGIVTVHIKR